MSSRLLPPNSTAFERAIADATGSRFDGLTPEVIATLWNPDSCPASALPWLAWALHVDNWDDSASEAEQRDSIARSVLLHRKKGTPWAMQQALATLGMEIDIIDRQRQRDIYAEHNPNRLDGSWSLDGSRQIQPLERLTAIPLIQHWAQFIVRLNLAELSRPEQLARLRDLIDEWKPARAWPIFVYWLRIYLTATLGLETHDVLIKHIPARYPWCGRVISNHPDAIWKLGKESKPVTLPAILGTFAIGREYGESISWQLKNCRMASRDALVIRSVVDLWPRETIPATGAGIAPTQLGKRARKIDGSWKIGTPLKIGAPGFWGSRLPHHTLNIAPRLGAFKVRNPGMNPARLKIDGSWRLSGPASPEFRIVSTRIQHG